MQSIWKNTTLVLTIVIALLATLFLQQCNRTKEQQAKLEAAERIATQNMKAMGDSTIQLQMTRKQLAQSDSALASTVAYVDHLIKESGSKKDKVREVIKVVPVVTQKDVEVYTTLNVDPQDSTKELLDFAVSDSVKSFKGTSAFYLTRTDSTVNIRPGKTSIRDFKLNFNFTVVKYDDAVAKVTRYKIIPFYTDAAGRETEISENQLKFDFRGVELLDKPFQEVVTSPITQKKTRLTGKWGLGVNPVGFGPVVRDGVLKFGYSPSISFGYFLTFEKR